MLTWPVDHPEWVYLILGVVALGLLIGLWTTRKREYAFGLGLTGILAVLFFLITLWIPTDLKRIQSAIHDMGVGVREKNAERIFAHVSEQFRLGSLDKRTFRHTVETVLQSGEVTDIVVWAIDESDITRQDRTARVSFQVRPEGPAPGDGVPYRCKATFVLDADGEWRMSGFQVFKTFADTREPIDIEQVIPH